MPGSIKIMPLRSWLSRSMFRWQWALFIPEIGVNPICIRKTRKDIRYEKRMHERLGIKTVAKRRRVQRNWEDVRL